MMMMSREAVDVVLAPRATSIQRAWLETTCVPVRLIIFALPKCGPATRVMDYAHRTSWRRR